MASNLVVFPINFLVVLLFRRARPRRQRRSRLQEALERGGYSDTVMTRKVEDEDTSRPSSRTKLARPSTTDTGEELKVDVEDEESQLEKERK